jgi:hypothetical protein
MDSLVDVGQRIEVTRFSFFVSRLSACHGIQERATSNEPLVERNQWIFS